MKAVVVSDLHPDANTAGYSRFGDVSTALWEAVKYACEKKADYFICAGDVITNDPSLSLMIRCLSLIIECSSVLEQNGIKNYWMAGNHDVFEDGLGTTVLDPLMKATFLTKVVKHPFYTGDIVFLPFTASSDAYEPSKYISEIKSTNVKLVVGHLNVEGITKGSEFNDFPRGREVLFPLEECKKLFPNAVLLNGHIHKRQNYKGLQIIGSLIPLTKGEVDNEPGFLVVDI